MHQWTNINRKSSKVGFFLNTVFAALYKSYIINTWIISEPFKGIILSFRNCKNLKCVEDKKCHIRLELFQTNLCMKKNEVNEGEVTEERYWLDLWTTLNFSLFKDRIVRASIISTLSSQLRNISKGCANYHTRKW